MTGRPAHKPEAKAEKPRGRIAAFLEEARWWLTARPIRRNRIDEANINRFFETGPELIEALVGAIACGQHVALAGPRGCGKSYCIGQAVKLAAARGLLPRNGWVKLQGNKELPRDYLLEDDMTFTVDSGVVLPRRKDAPLFRFAKRHADPPERRGRPVTKEGGLIECYGVDKDGQIILDEPILPHQRIALFLDEVNRFSDGVLDSLLLLLEEGEAVMGGFAYRLPVVVMMTMNPPGYDASARALSPPLSARIGRQYRLLSPRIDVLTDVIAPKVIEDRLSGAISPRVAFAPPSTDLVRRAAAVTLCAWGDPRGRNPGFDYLSEDTRALTLGFADLSPTLRGAMETLNELCHFGPDGRALGDWIVAASVAAVNQADALGRKTAQPRAEHFIGCAVTVLSHKLQDKFSSASRPDNTRRKEEALYLLASAILRSTDPRVPELLRRELDDLGGLTAHLRSLGAEVEEEAVRAAMIASGVTQGFEVERWRETIALVSAAPLAEENPAALEARLKTALRTAGMLELADEDARILPPEGARFRIKTSLKANDLAPEAEEAERGAFVFASEGDLKMMRWVADRIAPEGKTASLLKAALNGMLKAGSAYGESVERLLGHAGFIRAGLWSEHADLRALLREEKLLAMPRELLIPLFETLDQVWVGAEHEGGASVGPLALLLSARDAEAAARAAITEDQRRDAGAFAMRTLERIAAHPERGGGARAARRALRDHLRSGGAKDARA